MLKYKAFANEIQMGSKAWGNDEVFSGGIGWGGSTVAGNRETVLARQSNLFMRINRATHFHPDIVKWMLLYLFVFIRIIRRRMKNLGFPFIRVIRGLRQNLG
ncbi:MAG: hypothetical protein GXO78_15290 [Calditrichaeota bacterium]|nr:hypothetical protein [Calditrichota bacterium]